LNEHVSVYGQFNFQTIETDGIDFQFDYSLPLPFRGAASSLQFSPLFQAIELPPFGVFGRSHK